MRKHKKDPTHRSFIKGYQAAITGRSLDNCPYQQNSPLAYHWNRGWREGKHDQWDGYNSLTMQQKVNNM